MEEDLGYKIEEVREDLHEEFVNDMKDKLEERSVKETSSESEETTEGSESEETTASGESHIESNDGMVYVMETGEVSESKAELEIEESVEPDKEERPEVQQTAEENREVAEQEQSVKIRNSIVRPEALESEEAEPEEVETPERKKEHSTTEEHSIEEISVDEPKRDHEEKRVVKKSQEIEETSSIDSKEEIREFSEEKKDTEKEHIDTSNESRETSSENEREEIPPEHDEIIEDELDESLEVENDLELPIELPEEIEQEIEELAEELVEDLESQEEQVDESRIIVDAMTGKEYIDRSLEYRPHYQETEEGSEQNEQEKVKEKIDEMFAKLSEEEREKFKESVRSKLTTEEDLDEWVKRNFSVKASPDYKEKYKDAKKYLRGKQKGKVPRLIKELWKDEVERVWTSAVCSVILKSMDRRLAKVKKTKANKGGSTTKSDKTPQKRGQRGTYQINITIPVINGIKIHSYEQFLEIFNQEKPELLHRKDIKKLLHYCKVFLNLVQELEGKTEIHSYDISSISKRTRLSKTTIREWLTKGFVPRLLFLVNFIPPNQSERRPRISNLDRINKLEVQMNGILTMEILLNRLETLYIRHELKISEKSIKDASDFFLVSNAIRHGGISIEQIANMCNLPESKVKSILNRRKPPRLVSLLSSILTEDLELGWKWIPLEITGNRMRKFIKVPLKIESPNDLKQVLDQMKPHRTARKNRLEKQFGNVNNVHSFLYYLGLTISDGNFDTSKKGVHASARMKLKLAKKYKWSITAGQAYCHALERIGFRTRKGKDALTVRDDGSSSLMHVWSSVTSPFFIWVKRILLGLKPSETKNNNRINLDWILKMPHSWRVSLLQGISDGDASASYQGQFLQVHTYTNQESYKRLLTSLGIKSYSSTNYVGIGEKKSIRLAEQLPMFRHASSRQKNISKLLRMLDSHDWSRITPEEEEFIHSLHKQGYRVGIIIEKLWNKFGRTRRRNTIYEVIKRNLGKYQSKKKVEEF